MFLKEFTNNPDAKLNKLNRTLKENYNYELDMTGMTSVRASRIIENALTKLEATTNSTQRIKLGLIVESLTLWRKAAIQTELTEIKESIDDESVEGAKVIIAAKELSDKIQNMIEDAAKMQVQDLLPIVDAMKTEIGTAEADVFSSTADSALSGLVDSLKSAKEAYDEAIGAAQGQTPATDMDSFDDMDAEFGSDDVDMDAELDLDDEGIDDEFGGEPAEIGDEDPTGRELKDEL